MKQKIKLMKKIPQPSDEEIQKYMNFDRLLDSRKTALTATRNATIVKWGIAVISITAVVTLVLINNTSNDALGRNEKGQDTLKYIQPPVDERLDTLLDETQLEPDVTPKIAASKRRKPATEKKADTLPEATEPEYVQAEPLGGYSDLYSYFNANLVYPAEGLKDSIQGVQTISFIINKDGKPEQIEILKSLGEPFERESKRLIANMPGWKPATLGGKPVASKISLPLTFQIQKIKK